MSGEVVVEISECRDPRPHYVSIQPPSPSVNLLNPSITTPHHITMSTTTSTPISLPRFIEAIRDLELPLLHAEKARLQNSIFHLRRSNAQLESEIEAITREEGGADDEALKVLREAVDENREVIERQEERVRAVESELERRGVGKECGEEEQEGADGQSTVEVREAPAPTRAAGPVEGDQVNGAGEVQENGVFL